ncbi:MAG: hypothetical protein JWP04_151 [Belnapia sp.]|jgi:hypothetical protein|nr:hypothetical protein [Belnapia sp.]
MILPPPTFFHALHDGPDRVASFSHAVSTGPWAFVTSRCRRAWRRRPGR